MIGRNGSGKSSFAEALWSSPLTGDNQRWARRTLVWKEGWRNLHHRPTRIEATFEVEGLPGGAMVTRQWSAGAKLEQSTVDVQPHGKPKTDLSYFEWADALVSYRPFLSYSELGSLLDEGPSKLFDAVALVLGLDELTTAEETLRQARLVREKEWKAVLARRGEIVGQPGIGFSG